MSSVSGNSSLNDASINMGSTSSRARRQVKINRDPDFENESPNSSSLSERVNSLNQSNSNPILDENKNFIEMTGNSAKDSSSSNSSGKRKKRVIRPLINPDFEYSGLIKKYGNDSQSSTSSLSRPINEVIQEMGYVYTHGLSFSSIRIEKNFSEEWQTVADPLIAGQDQEIVKIWKPYFKKLERTGQDPAASLVKIQSAVQESMGLGLFAAQDIPVGTPLGEYGCYVTNSRGPRNGYTFNLPEAAQMNDAWKYDGLFARNHTAFMNHSENPNVGHYEYYDEKGPHIVFFANRNIKAGDELMINYGKDYWRAMADKPLR